MSESEIKPSALSANESAQKLRESGRLAYEAGIPLRDCPFASGSAAQRNWTAGWRVAQRGGSKT